MHIDACQVLPIALCASTSRSPIPSRALTSRAFAICLDRQPWRGRAAGCRKTLHGKPRPEKSLSFCAVENTSGPPDSDRPSSQALDKEIASLALPTLATLASDPLASLVDTGFLGHYGSQQLAASGVALSVHGVFTKLLNMPLLSVTTSTVATAMGEKGGLEGEAASVAASASLLLGLTAGILQAGVLMTVGGSCLGYWGAPPGSSIHGDALAFLRLRAIGCPTTLILLVCQGIFRGLGDTRTPLYATVACNLLNIILNPLLIFGCKMGVAGSALGTLMAQTIGAVVLVFALRRKVRLKLAGQAALDSLKRFIPPTGWLTLRTMSISGAFAFATSVAARTDSLHTATHQVCLQVWLAASLLADALAVAAQSLIARYLSSNDRQTAQDVTKRVLQLGFGLGLIMMAILGIGSSRIPKLFSSDPAVLGLIAAIWPWVALSQPINALAFVWDGILYGANGFKFAAKAAVLCAVPAVACMFCGLRFPSSGTAQLAWVWGGLILLMVLRIATLWIPYRRRSPPFDKLFFKQASA